MLLVKTELKHCGAKGYGLFAAEPIAKGQAWWKEDLKFDKSITVLEAAELPQAQQDWLKKYATLNNGEYYICLDDSRFTNHSDNPNTDGAVALRDIAVGEEITCDYRMICEGTLDFVDVEKTINYQPLSVKYISDCLSLIKNEWGDDYSKHFETEMEILLRGPYNALIGAVNGVGKICGVVVVSKAEMDFDFWSITWLVVDPAYRGLGIGIGLVNAAEKCIRKDQEDYPSGHMVVQLTTKIPKFFEKSGYKPVKVDSFDFGLMVKVL